MTFSPSRAVAGALALAVLSLPLAGAVSPAEAKSYHYKNCTALQKDFTHGVGKKGAKDKVKGKGKPVTTFKKSTTIYKAAVKFNSRLDADKDGVACEKR
ncbi:excalibur calcium-binding domain-containing protein [Microlunatus capsulatus]|uniref:Membrane protein n=1 Tax=Microlunatus capsulatus TaxID=99117 RepID=A0ABS4ZB32_9ACTN|nr:excalibur calcium-binding domain-containing protein [Microlunatus capsulatus]MBP2417912.1 putative membrane protein [Microlunatus capsulatus]